MDCNPSVSYRYIPVPSWRELRGKVLLLGHCLMGRLRPPSKGGHGVISASQSTTAHDKIDYGINVDVSKQIDKDAMRTVGSGQPTITSSSWYQSCRTRSTGIGTSVLKVGEVFILRRKEGEGLLSEY